MTFYILTIQGIMSVFCQTDEDLLLAAAWCSETGHMLINEHGTEVRVIG